LRKVGVGSGVIVAIVSELNRIALGESDDLVMGNANTKPTGFEGRQGIHNGLRLLSGGVIDWGKTLRIKVD